MHDIEGVFDCIALDDFEQDLNDVLTAIVIVIMKKDSVRWRTSSRALDSARGREAGCEKHREYTGSERGTEVKQESGPRTTADSTGDNLYTFLSHLV